MSKELPPELRPKIVPTDRSVMLAECVAELGAANVADDAWFAVRVQPDGNAQMYGCSDLQHSAGIALAALEAWAMAGEKEGDPRPRAVCKAVLQVTGATSEYVSGGLVPARK